MSEANYKKIPGEADRMDELHGFGILDSMTEKEYDDITRLASIICETPVALISFVDTDRQWFKSSFGVDEKETPREYSFCSHAIQSPLEAFVIEDSRLDNRFKDNPLVTGHHNLVFYAGIPLVTESGFGLGSVCVIDRKPRQLTQSQLDGLKILAGQIMNMLELRKSNLDLKENRELLDRHLSERTLEIAEQNEILEKMNNELQAFTYISSHDLQEPLRKIQTFTSWLVDKEAERLSEKGQEYLNKIGQSSARMSLLIRDLLNYSRATTTSPEFELTSLKNLVAEVTNDLAEEIAQKKASVTLKNDCTIKVIPFQFRQLIYNLMSNSLKFARNDIMPEIIVDHVFDTGSNLGNEKLQDTVWYHRICVADNGVGFDSQYSNKIFELFQRLGTRQVQIGTGVGLAIVKKIVENHNGQITASAEHNQGARFDVYIPEHI